MEISIDIAIICKICTDKYTDKQKVKLTLSNR